MMSYIPKYVLKRMIPQDAMKKVEGGGTLTMINMVATIPADQIPGSPLDIIEVKINGEEISKEDMAKVEVRIEGNTTMLPDIKELGTIPVNTTVTFFLPTDKFNVGEEVTVEVDVPIVSVHLEVTRTVTE
ncbi:MAG: hypothetical protein ACFFCS_06005 [Candidatus Hodarchaeota archaeon]